nr:MAG TPA: hypothetical protein [Caudoviricetes sp.]
MPKLSPPVSAIPMGCFSLLRVSISLRLVRAHLAKLSLLARLSIIIALRWLAVAILRWLVVAILLPISPSPLLAALLCLLILRVRRKRQRDDARNDFRHPSFLPLLVIIRPGGLPSLDEHALPLLEILRYSVCQLSPCHYIHVVSKLLLFPLRCHIVSIRRDGKSGYRFPSLRVSKHWIFCQVSNKFTIIHFLLLLFLPKACMLDNIRHTDKQHSSPQGNTAQFFRIGQQIVQGVEDAAQPFLVASMLCRSKLDGLHTVRVRQIRKQETLPVQVFVNVNFLRISYDRSILSLNDNHMSSYSTVCRRLSPYVPRILLVLRSLSYTLWTYRSLISFGSMFVVMITGFMLLYRFVIMASTLFSTQSLGYSAPKSSSIKIVTFLMRSSNFRSSELSRLRLMEIIVSSNSGIEMKYTPSPCRKASQAMHTASVVFIRPTSPKKRRPFPAAAFALICEAYWYASIAIGRTSSGHPSLESASKLHPWYRLGIPAFCIASSRLPCCCGSAAPDNWEPMATKSEITFCAAASTLPTPFLHGLLHLLSPVMHGGRLPLSFQRKEAFPVVESGLIHHIDHRLFISSAKFLKPGNTKPQRLFGNRGFKGFLSHDGPCLERRLEGIPKRQAVNGIHHRKPSLSTLFLYVFIYTLISSI